jgi:restriction endonuclease S subunit
LRSAAAANWPIVALADICKFMTGGTPSSRVARYYENGTIPWLVSGDIHRVEIRDCERRITELGVRKSNARYLPKDSVLIALNGQGRTRGMVALLRMERATCNQSLVAISPVEPSEVTSEYLFWVLRSMYADIRAITGADERSGLNIPILKRLEIPLPPPAAQKEVVAEMVGYQKVIDGARAVLESYRPRLPVRPDWPMVPIGEVCELINGRAFKLSEWASADSGGLPIVRIQNLSDQDGHFNYFVGEISPRQTIERGDLLFSWSGSRGTSFGAHIWRGPRAVLNQHIFKVEASTQRANRMFLFHALNGAVTEIEENLHGGVGLVHITKGNLERIKIPLPPLVEQSSVAAELGAEQSLIDGNRALIAAFEKKIQAAIARVWGDVRPSAADGRSVLPDADVAAAKA